MGSKPGKYILSHHAITCKTEVFFILVLSVTLLSGCGGTYDSTVSGVVTLDGKPVPRGTVAFRPVDKGPSVFGLIQSDGSYSLRVGQEEGLPPGEYKVTIAANEESTQKNPESSSPPKPGKPITPAWYKSPKTSGLNFTIKKGSNTIDLALTSDPPPAGNRPEKKGVRNR